MKVIDTSEMSRDQWLALRKQSIGASDAPVIAGLSKYKSRFALWLEKTGQSEPDEAGEEAWWGTRMEPLIEARLSSLGLLELDPVEGCNEEQVMVRAPGWKWMTATLDLVAKGGEVWEFKAAGFHTAKGLEDGNAETLPESWILQAHHQMACAQVDHINFAVFVGHRLNLYRFRVEHDEEIECGMLQLEREFWDHVLERTPPSEFDPSDAALLLKHYRSIEGEPIVNSNPKIAQLCERYEIASASAKFQSEIADQLKAALLGEMKISPAMKCQNYLMKRSTVNVKASTPKPKAAYSYTTFSFVNTEKEG